MRTLDECHTALTTLCAPLAAHGCKMVQVHCAGQSLEYQLAEVARERAYLIGYQGALKDLETHGNANYSRVIEAIDTALVSMSDYRDELVRRPL